MANNKTTSKGLVSRIKNSEQIVSMVMGILVVLVVGRLAYQYFQNRGSLLEGEKKEEAGQEEIAEEKVVLPASHTVSQGESLWLIAEKYFQSGYNWVDIAQKNNLQNPNLLSQGQKLEIPEAEPKEITIAELPATGAFFGDPITGDNYTVQEGDSLSKIAQRAYGDLYRWPEIWGNNRDKISSPNLIFPGQELKIPR